MIFRLSLLSCFLWAFSFCTVDDPGPTCCTPVLDSVDGGPEYELEYVQDRVVSGSMYVDSSGFIIAEEKSWTYDINKYTVSGAELNKEVLLSNIGRLSSRMFTTDDGILVFDVSSSERFIGASWTNMSSVVRINLVENGPDSFVVRDFNQASAGFLVSSYEPSPSRKIQFSWLENGAIEDVSLGFYDRGSSTSFRVVTSQKYQNSVVAVVVTETGHNRIQLLTCEIGGECKVEPIFSIDRLLDIREQVDLSESFIQDDQLFFSFETNEGFRDYVSVTLGQEDPTLAKIGTTNNVGAVGVFERQNPLGVYFSFPSSYGAGLPTYLYSADNVSVNSDQLNMIWEASVDSYGGFEYFAQANGFLYAYKNDAIFLFDEESSLLEASYRIKTPDGTGRVDILKANLEGKIVSLVGSIPVLPVSQSRFGYAKFEVDF